MLKAQDIVLLLKLLAHSDHLNWTQNQLAHDLCMSSSEVNAGLKRLNNAGLLQMNIQGNTYQPILPACQEFLISGVKYMFPAKVGEYTRGISTSYAAPIFAKHIMVGNDPVPVWPYAEGDQPGFALEPLYSSVPKSIAQFPDPSFYELLTLVDTLRHGRIRERKLAEKFLIQRLQHGQ